MVDLNDLIAKSQSKQATQALWQSLQATAVKPHSAPLNFEGSLLSVGGISHWKASSSVYIHLPDTKKWVKVGDLPSVRYNCTCSVLPSGEIIIAGGWAKGYVSTVEFLFILND